MVNKKTQKIPHHTDHEGKPRVIDCIRARANMDLTSVISEPMNFWQVNQQIYTTVLTKSPEYMVVLIEKDKKIKQYRASIYINKN